MEVLIALAGTAFGWCLSEISPFLKHFLWGPNLKTDYGKDDFCVVNSFFMLDTANESKKIRIRVFRIAVSNSGKLSASNCRAYLTRVERLNKETNEFEPMEFRDTLPLNWSYRDDTAATDGIYIPHGTTHHVDIVAAAENRSDVLVLLTKPEPFRYYDLVRLPGVYRFTIHVCADGLEPRVQTCKVKHVGKWDQAEIVA